MPVSSPPLFIVGCSRSGTTLLRLMLNQSSELHIPAESEFLLSLHDQRETYGDFSQPRQRWFFIRDLQTNEVSMDAYTFPIFELTEHEAEAAIADVAPTDFAGASEALFSASAHKHGKSRWGDKTPHYVRHIDWLAEAFPEAQFIHMIRDGRDVASSRLRAGFVHSIRRSARQWKQEVTAGRRSGARLPSSRYCELFYERLVRDPDATLRELCSWIDLPFQESMLYFHNDDDSYIPDEHAHLHERVTQPIDPSRAQAWKHSLSSREIADVEDVAGDLLSELEYELTGASIPLWLRALRTVRRHTASYTRSLRRTMERLGMS